MADDSKQYGSLIEEIRKNFQYASDYWEQIRQQARIDMRFASGDGWDPAERARREDPKQLRPCISEDELGQYINQLINDVRENPRAIKVIPTGNGANDKTAELHANKIRNIEYESNAQAAYITAFENAVQRSYGAARIITEYRSPNSFEQKICISRIPNPDTVYPDPDFREADGSDMGWCFVTDLFSWQKFRRKYPNASYQTFEAFKSASLSNEHGDISTVWATEKHVQVAEYWKVEAKKFNLCELANGMVVPEAEVPEKQNIIRIRPSFDVSVCQYLTNGAEVLDENPWLGKYIPIALCIGKELWVSDESGSNRIWESLQRKARGPQQLVNYYASTEAEVVRMIPKSPFVGAKGQFVNEEEWQRVNDTPLAYLLHDPWAGQVPGEGTPLPPPARPAYEPPIQALEIGKESARRAVQSAMGIVPLPTAAQRVNEKSGKALQRIQDETQKGSFHFVDNYERFLMHIGRIVDDLLPKVIDSPRDEVITKEDKTHQAIHIGEPFQDNGVTKVGPDGKPVIYDFGEGDHDITISTGPSFQSERDQADDFVDTFFSTISALPIPEPSKAQLIAIAIKLKDLGPLGDQMAEIISPQQQQAIPPQVQAQLAQLMQRLQTADATIAQLMAEKTHEMAKNQTTLQKAGIDMLGKVVVAEIGAKSQEGSERAQAYNEAQQVIHQAAHEVGMSQLEHAQTLAQTQQAAELAPPPGSEQNSTSGQEPGNGAT